MKPILKAVTLLEVQDDFAIVNITYESSVEYSEFELMGVDAGLSWIPGESISFEIEKDDESYLYHGSLQLIDSCEFRGRGHSEGADYWEDGSNNKLIKLLTGRIQLMSSPETMGRVSVNSHIPVNYDISEAEIEKQILEPWSKKPDILQLLISLSRWIIPLLEDPEDNEDHKLLSNLIIYMKDRTRELFSLMIDDLVRPVYVLLTQIYIAISTFSEDDPRILIRTMDKHIDFFKGIPDKVRKLEKKDYTGQEQNDKKYRKILEYI